MKVYVAAPWVYRGYAEVAADELRAAGHEITAEWWKRPDTTDEALLAEEALDDLEGVANADVLIVLQLAQSEGKAVETGYAIGKRKAVIVVRDAFAVHGNIFHHLPAVVEVADLKDAKLVLRALGLAGLGR